MEPAVQTSAGIAKGSIPNESLTPHLEGITVEDIITAERVLSAVANLATQKDGFKVYKQSGLRPFRKALAKCLEIHQQQMYEGKPKDEYYEDREKKRTLKRQKTTEKALQRQYIEKTALRQGRVDRLKAMQEEGAAEEKLKVLMIPDGHVDSEPVLLTENGETPSVQLPCLRSCYVCKVRYRDLHHFYDQLCPSCASLNWEKRRTSADMRGRVAIVTGARVKIGYHVTLKLLRAGCIVVATTRFPNSAVDNFRKEADFASFQDRLCIYGLDLRDVPGLEAFIRYLKQRFEATGIDALINNACQTVRRPVAYYTPMVEQEQSLWEKADETHRTLLSGCREFENLRRRVTLGHEGASRVTIMPQPARAAATSSDALVYAKSNSAALISSNDIEAPFAKTGLTHSAAMSQMIILPEDAGVNEDLLPKGVSDINGQQLDLRKTNSWLLKMEEVSTPELMECMFVNAMAPFILNSRLKPLMTIPSDDRPDRYIVNVSAMEGKVRHRRQFPWPLICALRPNLSFIDSR